MTEKRKNPKKPKDEQVEGTSPWEWVVAAVGGLLVTAAILYMVYYGLSHPPTPPEVTLRQTGVVETASGYLVRFEAHNVGNSTAAGLVIAGALTSGGVDVEESETTLDYLPGLSKRQGGLFFEKNPAVHEVKLQPRGYVEP
jgi:uncharacterized protein (TIGR02588 family)